MIDQRGVEAVMDGLEAFANSAIGFLVSWAATAFVLGYTATQSIAITGMFFVLSFTRGYIVRRIFRSIS